MKDGELEKVGTCLTAELVLLHIDSLSILRNSGGFWNDHERRYPPNWQYASCLNFSAVLINRNPEKRGSSVLKYRDAICRYFYQNEKGCPIIAPLFYDND